MPHGSYGPATGDRRCTIPISPTIRNSIMPNVLKEKLIGKQEERNNNNVHVLQQDSHTLHKINKITNYRVMNRGEKQSRNEKTVTKKCLRREMTKLCDGR